MNQTQLKLGTFWIDSVIDECNLVQFLNVTKSTSSKPTQTFNYRSYDQFQDRLGQGDWDHMKN